jgi:hypothetical protein
MPPSLEAAALLSPTHACRRLTTHPYDIHEILVAHQRIDPGYRLLV